ncbi:hypothetical protein [Chitinasiproducens palmae]|uniref:hypothetical protein n=1 Tax=Chitinasiproducens palmae TaxID=1770053 RepID=UPI001113315B|nr:hypothetical protein [Chitinasiproducens palmae]
MSIPLLCQLMSLRLFHRLRGPLVMRSCVAALAVTAVAACSPRYDWREVSDAQGRFTASFPAKMAVQSRTISVDGHELTMNMRISDVADTVFAVGAVDVPADDATLREHVMQYLEEGLRRNAGGNASQLSSTPSANTAVLTTHDWAASGTVPHENVKRQWRARFVATRERVYQVIVLSKAAPPAAETDQFLAAFQPYGSLR